MDLFRLLGARRKDDAPDDLDSQRRAPDGAVNGSEVAIDTAALTADDLPLSMTDANYELLAALQQVIDPEIGINIVDLGLVYAVERLGSRVDIVLTMTTPACPLSAMIEADVRDAIYHNVGGVTDIRVAIIFDPPWGPQMISDQARVLLGY